MAYLLRRLLHGALVLVGVSVLSFLFVQLAPGEFFSDMRLNPQVSPETIRHLRAQYGLDRALPIRNVRWARTLAKGGWGYSFAYGLPVSSLIWNPARRILLITITSALLPWLISIP